MTNRGLLAIVVAAIGMFATPLSYAQPTLPNPIANPGDPWAYAGFVVNAPDELGWQSAFKTLAAAALARKVAGSNHTYALTVNTLPIEEGMTSSEQLATYLRTQRGKESDFSRFEILTHIEKAITHLGQPCSRYSVSARDKGVAPPSVAPFLMVGITCVHPDKSDRAVDVGYSERGGAEQFADELRTVGERFIESLRFFSAKERPALKDAFELAKTGNFERVKQLLIPLADAGDRFIALRLGGLLLHDSKDPGDHVLARKYLEAAAADGHIDALYNLGAAYDKGIGGQRDVNTAILWFTRAADQRDSQAQLNLGILHHPQGPGIVKDIDVANNWFRMAADNGNERARQILRNQ